MTFLDGKILFSKDGLKNLSSLGLLYNVNLTLFQQEGRPWLFLYNPNGLVASLQQMECSRSDHEWLLRLSLECHAACTWFSRTFSLELCCHARSLAVLMQPCCEELSSVERLHGGALGDSVDLQGLLAQVPDIWLTMSADDLSSQSGNTNPQVFPAEAPDRPEISFLQTYPIWILTHIICEYKKMVVLCCCLDAIGIEPKAIETEKKWNRNLECGSGRLL